MRTEIDNRVNRIPTLFPPPSRRRLISPHATLPSLQPPLLPRCPLYTFPSFPAPLSSGQIGLKSWATTAWVPSRCRTLSRVSRGASPRITASGSSRTSCGNIPTKDPPNEPSNRPSKRLKPTSNGSRKIMIPSSPRWGKKRARNRE